MAIYVALLRGINVGGKNIIKMADLRHTFETIGLSRVKTYIQSGNILFESDKEEITIQNQLENKIQEVFGLSVPFILRTADEFKLVAENCPFTDDEISSAEASAEGESLYVAFLNEEPHINEIEKFKSFKNGNEDYRIIKREVYLLFSKSIRNSKLANNLQKLDVSATVRNWKTINKLVSLLTDMES